MKQLLSRLNRILRPCMTMHIHEPSLNKNAMNGTIVLALQPRINGETLKNGGREVDAEYGQIQKQHLLFVGSRSAGGGSPNNLNGRYDISDPSHLIMSCSASSDPPTTPLFLPSTLSPNEEMEVDPWNDPWNDHHGAVQDISTTDSEYQRDEGQSQDSHGMQVNPKYHHK